MQRIENLKIWEFENLKMNSRDTNVKVWKCEDVKIKKPVN